MNKKVLPDAKSEKMEERGLILNFFLKILLEEHLISEEVLSETKRRLLVEEASSEKHLSDAA